MAASNGRGTNDLGFIEDCCCHGIFHPADFLLIDADIPVHHSFLFSSE